MTTERTLLKIVMGIFVIAILGLGTYLVTADHAPTTAKVVQQPLAGVQEVAQPTLSGEQAVTVATSVARGTVSEIELKQHEGQWVYDVEFDDGETEFDVRVDATSGAVLKVEEENELGRKELDLVNAKFSEAQAKQLALERVPGTVTEVEASKVNGVYVYEVEIQQNGNEVDVIVDMMTGAILDVEVETAEEDDEDDNDEREEDDDEDDDESSTVIEGTITQAQAESIALEKVGGRVTDFEDEGNVYEVEIEKNGDEYDVLIDKNTGRVLDVERD